MTETAWRSRIVGTGDEAPDQLLANPSNWRIHPKAQQDALASVLGDVGWVQNVVVNRTTGHVVDGHLRVELSLSRGEPSVPVVYVELEPAEEALILATMDPLSAMAATDKDKLAELMAAATVSDEGLRAALRETAGLGEEAKGGKTDPDAVPEQRATEIQAGDLFELGDHRLLCGDCRSGDEAQRVTGAGPAAMMWTDPPYGVNYTGKTKDKLEIANDGAEGLPALLAGAFAVADQVLKRGAPIYVAHPAGVLSATFAAAFVDAGWHFHQGLVWVKNSMVLGHSDYHYQHEPLIYGWTPGDHPWHAGRSEVSVFQVDRPSASPDHPTGKPVELVVAHLTNSSVSGAVVYEPFSGSGTTLLAAEQLGRRCYAIEIEPSYCQVTIDRWEAFTGQTSKKVS